MAQQLCPNLWKISDDDFSLLLVACRLPLAASTFLHFHTCLTCFVCIKSVVVKATIIEEDRKKCEKLAFIIFRCPNEK